MTKLYLKRDHLSDYSSQLIDLSAGVAKETLCYGDFCCDFDITLTYRSHAEQEVSVQSFVVYLHFHRNIYHNTFDSNITTTAWAYSMVYVPLMASLMEESALVQFMHAQTKWTWPHVAEDSMQPIMSSTWFDLIPSRFQQLHQNDKIC
jgi:hypothetical protein